MELDGNPSSPPRCLSRTPCSIVILPACLFWKSGRAGLGRRYGGSSQGAWPAVLHKCQASSVRKYGVRFSIRTTSHTPYGGEYLTKSWSCSGCIDSWITPPQCLQRQLSDRARAVRNKTPCTTQCHTSDTQVMQTDKISGALRHLHRILKRNDILGNCTRALGLGVRYFSI